MFLVFICVEWLFLVFFFSSRRRHTRSDRDWSSDVCSSDLPYATCSQFDNSLTGSTFPNAEVEPQAAVHGSTAIAMWHQDRRSNGGARGIGVGYSTDGGASWTETTIALTACSAPATPQAL